MRACVTEALAELHAMDSRAIRRRWHEVFGRPAPKWSSRDLLLRMLAYRLQEEAFGGLSAATRRRLNRLAGLDGTTTTRSRRRPHQLKPGTRLVREWHGRTHHVDVLEDGFEYRGTWYSNLSRIARTITGTRWSGPLFFGLSKPRNRAHGS